MDASAGAELVADSARSPALRSLIPSDVSLAVPDHFYVEVSGVLRRWELNAVLTAKQASESFERLVRWPLRRAAVAPLLEAAWAYRSNMTISDALYVVVAERLGASFLTDDSRLANAPTFPASVPRLTVP